VKLTPPKGAILPDKKWDSESEKNARGERLDVPYIYRDAIFLIIPTNMNE
jgi:hypothetical protein